MAEKDKSQITDKKEDSLNIETLEGKIITDINVSLPRTEDFYYNDLVGNNYTSMIQQNIFYLEDPPENEDWMGFSSDKSLLTIKAKKEAFKTSIPFIANNNVTCSNITLDLSDGNISWPGSEDITNTINAIRKSSAFDEYRFKNGDENVANDATWLKDAVELRLLFYNPPSIPSWTTEVVPQSEIIKKTYKDIAMDDSYIKSQSPYPYSISYKNNNAIINTSDKLYEKDNFTYQDEDELYFIKDANSSSYHQAIPLNTVNDSGETKRQILVLNKDTSKNTTIAKAYKVRDLLVDTINKAVDIRIVLDVNSLNSQNQSVYAREYPVLYQPNLTTSYSKLTAPAQRVLNNINILKNSLSDEGWFANVGYNPYGLDAYKRIHGVVYVKVPNQNKNDKSTKQNSDFVWWNLNKYIIANLENLDQDTNTLGSNERYHVEYGPTGLKPYTYDYVNNQYVDGFWKDTLENDQKRFLVQQAIFAKNSDLLPSLAGEDLKKILYEWTVTIGDVTLFVPPESIRVIAQTSTQRAHLMRSRGAVAKGQEKSQQFFELNLFFNDERGINGAEYEQTSPNYNKDKKTGQKFVYKMNGLRALIAEMKFVPFVPIINKLFNETFGVYAVCFENLNISTVPGFPKLIKAQLQLSKFNYQVYMPEIPETGYSADGITYNPFACCIDYDVLRYYYQKPIILGDILDHKLNTNEPGINGADNRISVNSLEFYTNTIFANRTALLPCHFDDPTIRIYIANENRLKEMDQLKKSEAARIMDPLNSYSINGQENSYAASNYTPTDQELRLINDASIFVDNIDIPAMYAKYVQDIQTLANNLENPGKYGKFEITKNGNIIAESTTYIKDDSNSARQFINKYFYGPLYEEIKSQTENIKGTHQERLISDVVLNKNKITISFNTQQYCSSDSDFKNTQYEVASYIKSVEKDNQIKPTKIFSGRQIVLNLPGEDADSINTGLVGSLSLSTSVLGRIIRSCSDGAKDGKLNTNIDANAGLVFAYWCKNNGLPIAEANLKQSELKQSIDLETIHSLKYDLIIGTDMENGFTTAPADRNAIVKEFNATLGNTYARTSVSNVDGTAPQYMGGQDIHLSWTLETTNSEIARTFKNLPEITSYLTRTYRHVLPTYPIKIDSDFTRMLGVLEVMIENVSVETIPGTPGLYRISVIATSVDRTLRNKEALKALDVKNQQLSWSKLKEYKRTVNVHEKEELDKELCKAEIYPDLELPTCTELGELGFRYIRYKDKERSENNFYVDPDFYFIYPAITFGRVLLESLQQTFATQAPEFKDMSQYLIDSTGAKYNVDNKTKGVDLSSGNDIAKEQAEEIRIINSKKAEEDPIYHLHGEGTSIFKIPFGSWNVGHKIKCSFMEPYYLREIWKAKNNNTDSRCRIEINNKTTQQQIEEAKKKVDEKYAWIDIYNTDKQEVVSSTVNFNFKTDEEKFVENIEEHHRIAKEIKKYLKEHEPSVPGGTSPSKKIIKTEQIIQSVGGGPVVGPVMHYILNVPKWEDTDRAANQEDMINQVKTYLSNKDLQTLLQKAHLFGTSSSSANIDDIAHIIVAAADAQSGKEEYDGSNPNSRKWVADLDHMAKETERAKEINSDFVDSFGLYKIKRYKESDIIQILPDNEVEELKNKLKSYTEDEKSKNIYYILDPYYRFADEDKQKEYLQNCVANPRFAAVAFTRNVLWYLATLVEHDIYPSVEYDIKRDNVLKMQLADEKARKTINGLVNEQSSSQTSKGRMNLAQAKSEIQNKTQTLDQTNQKINEALQSTYKGQDTSSLINGMKTFVEKNGPALDSGKFFTATVFAMLNESFRTGNLFNAIKNRRYNELNGIIRTVVSSKFSKNNNADPMADDETILFRKYLLALKGHKVIVENDMIGYNQNFSPSNQFLTQYNAKLALLAASNPARYMRDSFYDMIRNDYRGRMLRAFPTFYMIFIDEGREIGLFRLHDNFYNINAIHEIQVVKSRLLAADTCTITMSNMFQTFTTNDEDCTVNYKGGLGDLWESFWSPKKAATRAEMLRSAADKINRAKLQPGIRIHVRLGYGANAKDLPIAFNGTIAEIQGNELVKVIAQGDGIELCNPIYDEGTSESIINKDIRFTMDSSMVGAPAKDILQSFLTAKGGPIAAMLRGHYTSTSSTEYGKTSAEQNDQLAEDIESIQKQQSKILTTVEVDDNLKGAINKILLKRFQNNPYGLFHFGDYSYKEIFPQGEPAQNLYEVTTSAEVIDPTEIAKKVDLKEYYKNANKYDKIPTLTQDNFAYFGDRRLDLNHEIQSDMGPWTYFNPKNNLPYLSFKPFGKTLWEIMHICQSVNPDYVTGIRDFEFRSTVFLGKPHYYCAYAYQKTPEGIYIEKRKPYQQWHLYHSSYDIIRNGITASSQDIKTNAVGLYEVDGWGEIKVEKTEPVWVDQDIYPEYQRSMIVNTNYYGKSAINGGFAQLGKGIGGAIAAGTMMAKAGAAAGSSAAVMGTKIGAHLGPKGALIGAGVGGTLGFLYGVFGSDRAAYFTNSLADKNMSTMYDETGPVRSHEKLAFKMTVNGLKDSMRQMYQGYLIVIGDPSVKPQDRIMIDDAYEDMNGMCEVREVIQQLSPDTGFTTTITPDLISAHEARNEIVKQNAVTHYISNISVALAISMFNLQFLNRMETLGFRRAYKFAVSALGKTAEGRTFLKSAKIIGANVGKNTSLVTTMDPIELQNKLEIIKNGLTKLKSSTNPKVIQAVQNIESSAVWRAMQNETVKKIATKSYFRTSMGAVARFGSYFLIVAEIALSILDSTIYKMIRNSQVLTLFPLQKFGKVFAAGVDGSEGLIYGALSYNNVGILESFYARFFSGSTAKDAGTAERFASWLLSALTSSDVNNAAARFQRDTEFVKNVIYNPYQIRETQLNSTFTSNYLYRSIYRPKTAYAASLMPRIVYGTDAKTKKSIINVVQNRTYIENVQDWMTNPNLRNLYYLPLDKDMERLFKVDFLRIYQDQRIKSNQTIKNGQNKSVNTDTAIQDYTFRDIQNRLITVHGLKVGEDREVTENGQKKTKTVTILDVPYLSYDAKLVLKEMAECVLSAVINYNDEAEIIQKTKDTYLVLMSALRIESQNHIYSSGYHFILQGTGKLKEKGEHSLRSILNKYYEKEKEKLKSDSVEIPPCFKIEDGKLDYEVGVIVYPASPEGNSIKAKKKDVKNKINEKK